MPVESYEQVRKVGRWEGGIGEGRNGNGKSSKACQHLPQSFLKVVTAYFEYYFELVSLLSSVPTTQLLP